MTPAEKAVRRLFKEKQQEIAETYEKTVRRKVEYDALRKLLPRVGKFYRTPEGMLLFFRDGDHKLYDTEEKPFERYLYQLTDEVAIVRHQWLAKLQAWVQFEAPEVETHFLAYNSADLSVIAINTFDGFMMRRARGGSWDRVPNGTDGVLFRTPPEFLTPWKPDLRGRAAGKDLAWLCDLGHFAGDGPLPVEDQQRLLFTWLLHLFFPALNPVHPIPLHEGVTGSGKSVLGEIIGRWLAGPQFEVMDLPSGDATKAEEAIKIALHKRPLVVIDNVDSPSAWLEDFLCRVATGVRMSRRKLYTNAEEVHFTPKAGLIITSRDPHFRREDVARRLLPIRFQPIPEPQRRSETELRAEVDARRGRIWADVLVAIARLQDGWPGLRAQVQTSHSLADFSIFGAALAAAEGSGPERWGELMGRLEQAQRRFTTEEDPLVEVLAAGLAESPGGVLASQPVRQLFAILRAIARERGSPWPYTSVGALTKALRAKQGALEQALGARIVLTNNHHGGEYRVEIQRVREPGNGEPGPQGANGGDG